MKKPRPWLTGGGGVVLHIRKDRIADNYVNFSADYLEDMRVFLLV